MGTHYKGSETEIRALDTYIKLMRAVGSLGSSLERRLDEEGLTGSQFGILEALLHLGPLCQRDLGQKLLTSGGNVTTVVDNLEKRGLVQRVRSEEDRRFVTVHLTDEGKRLITAVFPRHLARIVEALAALEPDEQEGLGRLCKKLGVAVAR
ncbi:MarR family winged helix-turn-helix transcriptional regulator [Vulgatibacter sp.]|uniref:MarR family winged helix-turn-helix transcriptional regulator n=1 Tax=Vulgatibacter sp. TaxID=1971226 RepID=UPI003562F361